MTSCPICDGNVTFDNDTIEGELIECRDCGTELEVISTDPYAIEEAPQEEEDWGE